MLKGGVVALALVPLVMALWFLTRSGIGEGRLACLFFAVLFTLLLRAPFDAVLFRDNQITFLLLILLHGLATREAQARQPQRQASSPVRAAATHAAARL